MSRAEQGEASGRFQSLLPAVMTPEYLDRVLSTLGQLDPAAISAAGVGSSELYFTPAVDLGRVTQSV